MSALERRREAIVIGASAGSVEVLMALLPKLPATYPTPIMIVVHVPSARPSLLVELFAPRCELAVAEPMDKEPVRAGIWFAPAGYHLLVEADKTFSLSLDEHVQNSRPAIDVLFESAAECYGEGLLGIVLTGASADGANGTRLVQELGGSVLAQSPDTAQAPTMPLAAIEAGAQAMPIDGLGRILMFAGGIAK